MKVTISELLETLYEAKQWLAADNRYNGVNDAAARAAAKARAAEQAAVWQRIADHGKAQPQKALSQTGARWLKVQQNYERKMQQ